MNLKTSWQIALVALSIMALPGCSKSSEGSKLPELNAENCSPERIADIKNDSARRDFSSKCLRLGKLSPSQKKEW